MAIGALAWAAMSCSSCGSTSMASAAEAGTVVVVVVVAQVRLVFTQAHHSRSDDASDTKPEAQAVGHCMHGIDGQRHAVLHAAAAAAACLLGACKATLHFMAHSCGKVLACHCSPWSPRNHVPRSCTCGSVQHRVQRSERHAQHNVSASTRCNACWNNCMLSQAKGRCPHSRSTVSSCMTAAAICS